MRRDGDRRACAVVEAAGCGGDDVNEDTRADLVRYATRKKLPTDERTLRALLLACRWLHGLHHMPDTVRAVPGCGGIELVLYRGKTIDTFDFDEMTRLVFLAHDCCVRADIGTSGMHLCVSLYPRDSRDGYMYERHPTLERAVTGWRSLNPKDSEYTPAAPPAVEAGGA